MGTRMIVKTPKGRCMKSAEGRFHSFGLRKPENLSMIVLLSQSFINSWTKIVAPE
jgi:hypothetical protein